MKCTRLLGAVSAPKKQTLLEEGFSLRTSINTLITRLVLLVAGCLVTATVYASGVQRVNYDGSGLTTLLTVPDTDLRGIALDVGGGHMYWADTRPNKVQRATLDGSGVTDLVTGLDFPGGIALDLDAGHIYFTSAVVPLPASLWLFGTGLLGLVGIARRKQSA